MDEVSETIARFTDALQEVGITYAIAGSIASSVVGEARSTRDVDMIASMSHEQASALSKRVENDFYLDELAARRAIEEGDCFNAIDLKTMYQIDLFVPQTSAWVQSQFQRRVKRTIGGADGPEVYLCSPEDVILSKLVWFRLGNEASNQQMLDVIGVLRVQQGKLDQAYMRKWARDLAVEDLLDKALESP